MIFLLTVSPAQVIAATMCKNKWLVLSWGLERPSQIHSWFVSLPMYPWARHKPPSRVVCWCAIIISGRKQCSVLWAPAAKFTAWNYRRMVMCHLNDNRPSFFELKLSQFPTYCLFLRSDGWNVKWKGNLQLLSFSFYLSWQNLFHLRLLEIVASHILHSGNTFRVTKFHSQWIYTGAWRLRDVYKPLIEDTKEDQIRNQMADFMIIYIHRETQLTLKGI